MVAPFINMTIFGALWCELSEHFAHRKSAFYLRGPYILTVENMQNPGASRRRDLVLAQTDL